MKKKFKYVFLFFVVLITVSVTAGTTSASDYDSQADSLKSLGLFYGTDSGYDLDRAPSRTEAGVMLVRLLGKEDEVLTGSYEIFLPTFPHGPTII